VNGPPVYSVHIAYWWWGPPPESARRVIIVGWWDDATIDRWFTRCSEARRVHNSDGVDNEENGAPVRTCDGPKGGWKVMWPQVKHLG
jgi:hypothetical protein